MRHLTCDPNVEIIGMSMQMFLLNIKAAEIAPYLEKHGLSDIRPDEWYSLQGFLNVMNDMADGGNIMTNYVAIGMAATQEEIIAVPPEILASMTLEQILSSFSDVFKQQIRGGYAGEITTERVADQHYQLIYKDVPLPDHFLYGSVFAVTRTFSKGAEFKVWYDTSVQRMDEGGVETIIHVEWE